MGYRFNTPPNWPAPPTAEWVPPAGWRADPSWGPAPDGWVFWVDDQAAPRVGQPGASTSARPGRTLARGTRTGRPVLTIVLLSVAVLFSLMAVFGSTDKEFIGEDPPVSAGASMAGIWTTAGLVLVAIALAALRPRTRTVRIVILALVVPVVGGAVLGTVRLNELSASGFIREAQLAKAQADAAQAELQARLVTVAGSVCRGTVVPRAAPLSDPPRVVVLDEQGQLYGWDAVRDRGWAPESVDDLQVVVCLGPETRSVETCEYTTGISYDLTSFQREMSVLRAVDGTALLSGGSVSGEGSECYKVITGGHVQEDVTADHVDADAVLDGVEQVLPGSDDDAS